MLERLEQLSPEVCNIIIYTNSAVLENVLKRKIKEIRGVQRHLVVSAESNAELNIAKKETLSIPFGGGEWFVDVQADKIQKSDIAKALSVVSDTSVTVYWFTNYMAFKNAISLDVVAKQGNYCFTLYAGKAYPEDVTYIKKEMLPDTPIKAELLDYLKKNYMFNVDAICKLFFMISQGEEIETTKDIVSKVGVGGNNVDSFVIHLLTRNYKTEKGLKKGLEGCIKLLEDLAYTYSYRQIREYMRNSINTLYDMKQLQIMGKYGNYIKDIPSVGFNEDKINRYKRYERKVFEEINMPRLLKLRLYMTEFKGYDDKVILIQIITAWLNDITQCNINNPDSKENRYKRRG